MEELSSILHCNIYAPNSKDIASFNVTPNIEYVTYSSYTIDPEKFENVWSFDPGLNEERWAREQDHFYQVLEETGERGAYIAMTSFLKTDERNVYLHQFPMEKIVHDQLLRNEFQIDLDYQQKKRIVARNWYHFKKRFIEHFKDEKKHNKTGKDSECTEMTERKECSDQKHEDQETVNEENNTLRVYADDLELDEPLILQPLFVDDVDEKEEDKNQNNKNQQILHSQTLQSVTTNLEGPPMAQKPKYHPLSTKKKEKRSPKCTSI